MGKAPRPWTLLQAAQWLHSRFNLDDYGTCTTCGHERTWDCTTSPFQLKKCRNKKCPMRRAEAAIAAAMNNTKN